VSARGGDQGLWIAAFARLLQIRLRAGQRGLGGRDVLRERTLAQAVELGLGGVDGCPGRGDLLRAWAGLLLVALGLRALERGLGLGHVRGLLLNLEPQQRLAGLHKVALVHENLGHHPALRQAQLRAALRDQLALGRHVATTRTAAGTPAVGLAGAAPVLAGAEQPAFNTSAAMVVRPSTISPNCLFISPPPLFVSEYLAHGQP
jgi:hypothetical protein